MHMIQWEVLSNKKKEVKKNLYIIRGNKETLPVTISSDVMNHTKNDLCNKINIILCMLIAMNRDPFYYLLPLLRLMIDRNRKIKALKQCEIQNRFRINTIYQPTQAKKQAKWPLYSVLLIALTLNEVLTLSAVTSGFDSSIPNSLRCSALTSA